MFNRWGDIAAAHPDLLLVVRYEDLKFHPAAYLRRIATPFCIEMNDDAVATAMRFVSRDGDGDRRLRELIRRLRAS